MVGNQQRQDKTDAVDHHEQHLQSSRQNSQPSKPIARSFLSFESKPFRLKLSRCCSLEHSVSYCYFVDVVKTFFIFLCHLRLCNFARFVAVLFADYLA